MGASISEEASQRNIAKQLGMPYLDLLPPITSLISVASLVPYSFAKKHLLILLEESEDRVTVAIADPLNLQAIDELHLMLDRAVSTVVAPRELIQSAIDQAYHHKKEATDQFLAHLEDQLKVSTQEEEHSETYDLLEIKEDIPVIKLLNLILSEAISQGASDIHFEPMEQELKIRYRIDGVLQTKPFPVRDYQSQLLTRIKVLAKLDIAEHRLPQDGRMKVNMGGRSIDFRVSTIPITHGERIVLRLLDKNNVVLGIDQLGFLPKMLDQFRRLLSAPEGIVLVTGPTGSGKTTTLYSALWELYNEEFNIMTIEDPIEYKIQGISQIGIHPKIGLTFAKGLRHILRQDPDVVMVGEIRDSETSEMAIQAALTGHLVLSTLHTNDAPSAIPRLIDMGIEPYLISSTLVGILAQRLVRRVCPHCRQAYRPSSAELNQIGLKNQDLNGGVLYRGVGCEACNFSGYKGRHGLYELLPITSQLQSLIATRPSASQLMELAQKEKIITTLREHGLHLIRAGVTTITEVLRVTKKGLLAEEE